jgi:hypothetical protein
LTKGCERSGIERSVLRPMRYLSQSRPAIADARLVVSLMSRSPDTTLRLAICSPSLHPASDFGPDFAEPRKIFARRQPGRMLHARACHRSCAWLAASGPSPTPEISHDSSLSNPQFSSRWHHRAACSWHASIPQFGMRSRARSSASPFVAKSPLGASSRTS